MQAPTIRKNAVLIASGLAMKLIPMTNVMGAAMPSEETVDCTTELILVNMGSSTTCSGNSFHAMPVGFGVECYGWRATDNNGKLHDNSANNFICNEDGSFSFTQYGNSLDCTQQLGPRGQLLEPVTKTVHLGVCEQDIPPTIYLKGSDFSCCRDPMSESCRNEVTYNTPYSSGNPSLSDESYYRNGKLCKSSKESEATSNMEEPESDQVQEDENSASFSHGNGNFGYVATFTAATAFITTLAF